MAMAVGMGKGKSKEVPAAVQKAMDEARATCKVSLKNGTIHHNVTGHHGAATVMMAPAPRGTGIIAGGPMRAVFEVLGITDIVAKSHGVQPLQHGACHAGCAEQLHHASKWRPSAASRSKTSSPPEE
jgi:ribosomal protein S5